MKYRLIILIIFLVSGSLAAAGLVSPSMNALGYDKQILLPIEVGLISLLIFMIAFAIVVRGAEAEYRDRIARDLQMQVQLANAQHEYEQSLKRGNDSS